MLRHSLTGEPFAVPQECDRDEWEGLFKLALSHRIETLILNEALSCNPPPAIAQAWQERAMAQTLRQMQIVDELHTALAALDEAKLRVVVLKGVVLKALYPDPDARQMSDADLLIGAADFAAGRELLLANGFAEDTADTHDDTFVCASEAGLRIELHKRLFEQKKQGFLAGLDEDELFKASAAVRWVAHGGEGEVWSLPPTEHALFQVLHMAKHMITTGFGLRQVCDFGLFTKAYEDQINWGSLTDELKRLNLMKFTSSVMWICKEKLGLSLSNKTEFSEVSADKSGAMLLYDIMDAGVFGKSSGERQRSAAITLRAFDSETTPEGWFERFRRAVFIRADELRPPFEYAKARKFLLPAAWIHRLVLYILQKKMSDAAGGMRVADERITLLRSLDMMK
jgi:hypothetical protein